uniref:Uncharacterized protein n=1 Tax=Ditylenchus dipsaci TaxID=166011 RepID=A0A915EBT3_9BILA
MYSILTTILFKNSRANNVYSIDPVSKETAESASPIEPSTSEQSESTAPPASSNTDPEQPAEAKPAAQLEPVADVGEAEQAGNEASAKEQSAVAEEPIEKKASAEQIQGHTEATETPIASVNSQDVKPEDTQTTQEVEHVAELKTEDPAAAQTEVPAAVHEEEHTAAAGGQEVKPEQVSSTQESVLEVAAHPDETEAQVVSETQSNTPETATEAHSDVPEAQIVPEATPEAQEETAPLQVDVQLGNNSAESKESELAVKVNQTKSTEKKEASEEAKSPAEVSAAKPEDINKNEVLTKAEEKVKPNVDDKSKNIEPVKTAESIEQQLLNGHTKEGPKLPVPQITKSLEEKKPINVSVATSTEMSKEKTGEAERKKMRAILSGNTSREPVEKPAQDLVIEEEDEEEESTESASKEVEQEEEAKKQEQASSSFGMTLSRLFGFGGSKPAENKLVEEPKEEVVTNESKSSSNETQVSKEVVTEPHKSQPHSFFSRMVVSTGSFFGSITRSMTTIY